MYRIINDKLTKVIKLARNKNQMGTRKKLTDYLETLKYEDIKIIQTIMYIGRDTSYGIKNEEIDSDKLFQEFYISLTWDENKYIEINQIIEKEPLDKYLTRGMELLKIK